MCNHIRKLILCCHSFIKQEKSKEASVNTRKVKPCVFIGGLLKVGSLLSFA